MKLSKFILFSIALLISNAFAQYETRFVYGVDQNSGWYDVNKTFDGTDDDLCWAAAISNVIHWWQNFQPVIPENTPVGTATERYSSDIFQTFVNSFVNDGGEEGDGFDWWLTGETGDYDMKPGASDAGFWKNIYADADDFINFYQVPTDGSGINALESFSSTVVRNVDLGYAMTIGVYSDGGAHAATMWGFDLDPQTGYIVAIHMADSDNVPADGEPHMEPTLTTYNITYDTTANQLNMDKKYTGWHIGDLTFIRGLMIPEPSTATLAFAGLMLITFRRKKA